MFLCVVVVALAGCESAEDVTGGRNMSMDDLATKIEGKAKPAPAPPVNAAADAQPKTTETPAATTTPAAASREPATVAGAAGVAVPEDATRASDRGALKSNPNNYLGAVAGANRNIREVASDWAWQKSVQLFEASNGRKPRDTNEFLDLIRGEGTPIPELPPGFTYLYVPEEGQFGQLYKVPIEETPSAQPADGRGAPPEGERR